MSRVLVVVETEDNHYLGTVIERGISTPEHVLIIRNGYVGRPFVVPAAEVTSICRADRHPLVDMSAPS